MGDLNENDRVMAFRGCGFRATSLAMIKEWCLVGRREDCVLTQGGECKD